MHLREHDEQLLQAQHLLLQIKIVLFHFVILAICLSKHSTMYLFCFLFSRAGAYRGEGGNRGLCGSGNGCLTKKRTLWPLVSTLLNELRTGDEKAFYNYTRLLRGLYDEVLRRQNREGHMVQKSLPPSLKLSIHSTTPGLR